MNRPLFRAAFALAAAYAVGTAHAAIEIQVYPSSAPNVFGSPSWNQYRDNALNSIENGLGNIGDSRFDPTAYEVVKSINAGEILVSGFRSWHGYNSPPAQFNNEYGNRLHFGVHVLGHGTRFSLEDLYFQMHSTQGDDLIWANNFIGVPYNANRVGIDYVDGIKGNGNDIRYDSGQSGTLQVDELVYVGVGNAYDATFEVGTDQEKLDSVIAYMASLGSFTVTCEYTIKDGSLNVIGRNSASVKVGRALPIDLNGKYSTPGIGASTGYAAATTHPLGYSGGGQQVLETSSAGAVFAQDGNFTPFSDSVKPPIAPNPPSLVDSFFDVFVDLNDVGNWGSGDIFVVSTGSSLFNEDGNLNGSAGVAFDNNGGSFRIRLFRADGVVTFGPSFTSSDCSNFDLRVSFDNSGNMSVHITAAEGASAGGLGTTLGPFSIGGVSVGSTTFVAGFGSGAGSLGLAKASVCHFSTNAVANSMFVYCDDPYVKLTETAHYNLGMANMSQAVRGFQGFLTSNGSQNFGAGNYTLWPFANPIISITGALDFSAGSDVFTGQAPTDYNGFMADIYFTSAADNASWLVIDPDNGNPLTPTRFANTSGGAVAAARQNSNRVVYDSTAPVVTIDSVMNAGNDLCMVNLPLVQGTLEVNATSMDAGIGSGLMCNPSVWIDFAPLGPGPEDINATMGARVGNEYRFTTNVTPSTPNGSAIVYVTSMDDAGNVTTVQCNINVNVAQILATVELKDVSASMTRGIKFVVGGTGGANSPITVQKNIAFVSGVGSVTLTALDGIPFNSGISEISAKDELHTLRKKVSLVNGGNNQYSASFTGANALRGGDATNDNAIDILDFGVFASQFGQNVGANTPIGTTPPHSDFSGNGIVDTPDYTFVQSQFLFVGDNAPGNYGPAPKPKKTATVKEFLLLGVKQAPQMDLDGDGWLTFDEIQRWLFGGKR